MEEIQGRPNLGEVFCPPRYELNEDNEYLANVGLIILITGLPSPDMPRVLATKLASVYGGHPNSYPVYEASATPYLITCANTRIRDAIVQGGIYSIPHRRIRFTVHEWRPRFGLGHDPTTHQVWVRILGLPLQAWTTKEITVFLQKFGHPVNILPYGREAGHFRDITALVNTGHPRHIPIAYKYREEDYSTLVQVIILSSRQWAQGDFPPPENQTNQQPTLSRQQQHNTYPTGNLRTPTQNSSSSSDGSPIEPTVDLSCWSPRNCRTSPTVGWKWKPKKQQPKQNQSVEKEKEKETVSTVRPKLTYLISPDGSILLDGSIEIRTPLHGHKCDAATANPLVSNDPPGTHKLIRVSICAPALRHIAENLLEMLATPPSDKQTLGELTQNPVAPSPLNPYCTVTTAHKKDLTISTLRLSPSQQNVDTPFSLLSPSPFSNILFSEQSETGRSPNKPNASFCFFLTPTLPQISQAHPSHWPVSVPDSLPQLFHRAYLAHSQQPQCDARLSTTSVDYPTQIPPYHLFVLNSVWPTPQRNHEELIPSENQLFSHQITQHNPTVQKQRERTQNAEIADTLLPQLSPIL